MTAPAEFTICAGLDAIGAVRSTAAGYEARDADGRDLGTYATRDQARQAVREAAEARAG